MALDLSAGKIYWGDRESSKIQRTNLDPPGAVEDLFGPADGLDRPHGLLLSPAENKIYWTDTRTLAIHRGNTDGSGTVEPLVTGLNGPWALAFITLTNIGDFDHDSDVDFNDLALLALAWQTQPGDTKWNPTRDIATPKDNKINMLDLKVLAENFLASY